MKAKQLKDAPDCCSDMGRSLEMLMEELNFQNNFLLIFEKSYGFLDKNKFIFLENLGQG